MKRLPAASTARPTARYNRAAVAGPPSPEKPGCPVRATVIIVPGAGCSAARLISAGESAVTPTAMEPYKKTRRFIETLLVSQVHPTLRERRCAGTARFQGSPE